MRLLGLILEVGDQVVPVRALLETTEGHLGAGNVLLWVLEVLKLRDCQSCVRVSSFCCGLLRECPPPM
jgi:hypothetical protein